MPWWYWTRSYLSKDNKEINMEATLGHGTRKLSVSRQSHIHFGSTALFFCSKLSAQWSSLSHVNQNNSQRYSSCIFLLGKILKHYLLLSYTRNCLRFFLVLKNLLLLGSAWVFSFNFVLFSVLLVSHYWISASPFMSDSTPEGVFKILLHALCSQHLVSISYGL